MSLQFSRATKQQEKLRLAIDGPAGSGKTFTSLLLACELGQRVAMIDTERGSGRKYANLFTFDHLWLPNHEPHTFTEAIDAAVAAEYDVIVVDSFSHAWEGMLAVKDRLTAEDKRNDSFGVWRQVTPLHDRLVDLMLSVPAHLIATLRTKTAYDYQEDQRSGKNRVVKVGTKPIAREGVEYEFDVVADMDLELNFSVSKTRCPELSGHTFNKPGPEVADILSAWLSDGEPVVSPRQANELLVIMNALAPSRRRECKDSFVNTFGRPEKLPAAELEAARDLVAKFATTGNGTPADAQPAEAQPCGPADDAEGAPQGGRHLGH